MCGIVGYVGERNAAPILLDGLQKLEYRGYDSAGIAVAEGGKFTVVKRKGRVKGLNAARSLAGKTGVGHTRWATHGAPSERNAHPHLFGGICVVHNGIVENAAALKAVCEARGETFSSETDSEVIAHLIAAEKGDLLHAVRAAAEKLVGSYAIAVLSESAPDTIVCARKASPLVVGYGEDGLFVASDIPAIAAAGRTVYALSDGEFAVLKKGTAPAFYDASLRPVEKREIAYDAEEDIPEKRGFRHFMKKEIAEVPEAVARSIPDLSKGGFSELYEVLCQTEYYDYEIKRINRGKTTTIYDGKYRKTICDNSVKAGETYIYTVCPKYREHVGTAVTLPQISIPDGATLPDDWWTD